MMLETQTWRCPRFLPEPFSPIKTTSMTNCETSACINKVVLWRPLEQFVRFSRGICREHPRSLLKHSQSFWSISSLRRASRVTEASLQESMTVDGILKSVTALTSCRQRLHSLSETKITQTAAISRRGFFGWKRK